MLMTRIMPAYSASDMQTLRWPSHLGVGFIAGPGLHCAQQRGADQARVPQQAALRHALLK